MLGDQNYAWVALEISKVEWGGKTGCQIYVLTICGQSHVLRIDCVRTGLGASGVGCSFIGSYGLLRKRIGVSVFF